MGDQTNGVPLVNEIRNQIMYFRVLKDKHDNSLINSLRDLNNLLNTATRESGKLGKFDPRLARDAGR